MRTKIKVDILKTGEHNGNLLKAIASHNEGTVVLNRLDLISYANVLRGIYPLGQAAFSIEDNDSEPDSLRVTEDNGKTFTLIISFIELHELDAAETDNPETGGEADIPEPLFTS